MHLPICEPLVNVPVCRRRADHAKPVLESRLSSSSPLRLHSLEPLYISSTSGVRICHRSATDALLAECSSGMAWLCPEGQWIEPRNCQEDLRVAPPVM